MTIFSCVPVSAVCPLRVWTTTLLRSKPGFIRSGFADDQINHIYGFVYDPEAEGLSATLDPRKIQEAALATNPGMWTDTVTPGRLWADIHDV